MGCSGEVLDFRMTAADSRASGVGGSLDGGEDGTGKERCAVPGAARRLGSGAEKERLT